jgi:hypothetical protein
MAQFSLGDYVRIRIIGRSNLNGLGGLVVAIDETAQSATPYGVEFAKLAGCYFFRVLDLELVTRPVDVSQEARVS